MTGQGSSGEVAAPNSWPAEPPTLTYDLVRSLTRAAQSGDAAVVLTVCRGWIELLGDDDHRQFWFRYCSFAAVHAEPTLGDEGPLTDEMVEITGRWNVPALEAIARAARAVIGGSRGRPATAVIDLAKATVLLDSGGPLPQDTPLALNTVATAMNSLGQALMRNGLGDLARHRLGLLREIAQDPRLAGLSFIVDGNIGWSYLSEGLELRVEGRDEDAVAAFRAAGTAFELAERDEFSRTEQPTMHRAVRGLGIAMAAMAGDPAVLPVLLAVLGSADYLRPEHRAVLLLGHSHLLRMLDRPDEAARALSDAQTVVPVDRAFRSISSLVMTELIALAAMNRPPGPTELAQQKLLGVLLQERRRELHSRRAAYDEALQFEQRHLATSRQSELASLDVLTGMHNRRVLESEMELSIQQIRSTGDDASLAFIDLDRFKQINEAHNHLVGDEVLRLLGECLRSTLSDQDVALRYGGDEFVVLFRHRGVLEATAALALAAERLAVGTQELVQVGRRVSFTCGVVSIDPHSTTEALILQADEEMLRTKSRRTTSPRRPHQVEPGQSANDRPEMSS